MVDPPNFNAPQCDILVYIGSIYLFFLFYVFGVIGLLGHRKKKRFTRRQHRHFYLMRKYRSYIPEKGFCRLSLRHFPKESVDDNTLQLFVICTGRTIAIQVNKSASVTMLMKKIHFLTGIPVEAQFLTNGLRPLVPGSLLSTFCLVNHSTLQLSLRLLGGAGSRIAPYWTCPACTYHNEDETFEYSCELCGMKFSSNQWKANSNRVTLSDYPSNVDDSRNIHGTFRHCIFRFAEPSLITPR